MKRAVLYARVSGDDRGKDNLEGQIEMGREYAQERGYTIVKEIKEDDRGARGASFDLPGLNEALEMARNGEFDVLVVRELDRFARRLAKQLIIESEFKRAEVEIDYVLGEYPDTPEGNLNKNLKAVIAEYEALKITERTARGRRRKVKAGNVMVGKSPPYGYKVIDRDGKRALGICEPEAQVVRMIFAWYTEGDGENGPMSLSGVTQKLSRLGIPTYTETGTRKGGFKKKKGREGKWCSSTVHSMLRNETYAGTWRYGKRNNPGGKWERNPDECLLIVAVPSIVSRETWEAAQARLKYNRQNAPRNKKYQYLMSGHVICGKCGVKVQATSNKRRSGKVSLYYRCPATTQHYDYARSCDAPGFRADQVDAVVWEWVKTFLTDPVTLQAGLENYRTKQDKTNTPLRERLTVIDDLIAHNQAQLERALDLYLSGDFLKGMLIERKTRLETTIGALERERGSLAVTLEAQTLTQEQIQTIREFAAEVRETLGIADASFEARRRVIEVLNVQATLTVERNEKIVYTSCALGEAVLSIASYSTTDTGCNPQKPFALTARIVLPKPTRSKRAV